jgi:vitamin K-dependent gamma-carboxylase
VVIASPEPLVPPQASAFKEKRKWLSRLFAPVDIAPLVFFRITFGILMILEVVGYTAVGLVERNWIRPETHFTYFGFGWVKAPPGNSLYVLMGVLLLSAIGITFGAFYRISAGIFAIGFTWFYLIEQSTYMNHFYLICLLAGVAWLLPLHRAFSIDVRRKPELRASTAPIWTLWLLQAHMAIGYFFGGVAKINHDWLRGEPVRTWLYTGSMGEKLGDFFKTEFWVYFISYGGMLFDLLVVPFLLWKKTRLLALAAAIFFHLSNSFLFNIGVFPFLSIAMTLLFLSPSWHRKVLRLAPTAGNEQPFWRASYGMAALLAVYLAYHLFMPFRHWLYPGNVHWTEEGHRYAWHMMLRTKDANAYFIIEEKKIGRFWRVQPEVYLSRRQYKKMSVHPEMLLQCAHFLRDRWKPHDVAVYAVAAVQLNDHPPALLVDPEVDLSREKLGIGPSDWILPFKNSRAVPERYWNALQAPKR